VSMKPEIGEAAYMRMQAVGWLAEFLLRDVAANQERWQDTAAERNVSRLSASAPALNTMCSRFVEVEGVWMSQRLHQVQWCTRGEGRMGHGARLKPWAAIGVVEMSSLAEASRSPDLGIR